MPDGASFAYVFGAVLVFLLVTEAVTGAMLAAFYAPSTGDAWASVAYVQDQAAWGWLVRGLHVHGASAIVIVAGLHLVQTGVYGAYKRPREIVWWLGILSLVLLLVWAVTGYVLRWDQAGYWANKVEVAIAASTPVIGGGIRAVAIGGNEYGNLTLTRFYMLHVVALPVIVGAVTVAHVRLARRFGPTARTKRPAVPRWPDQSVRDAVASAIAMAVLLAYVVAMHGADLAAPADPAAAYDARPLWYFRWLFELRELAGSWEKLAALAAPAIAGGALVALPLLDKGPSRAPRHRVVWIGALGGLLALIAGLTAASFARDRGDEDLAKREAVASDRAELARRLARENGVPATGAQDVFATPPMYRARALYAQRCSGCHDAKSKDRKGPVIAAGHGNRAWIRAFLAEPSGDAFWGHTKLAKDPDLAMKPVELKGPELDQIVEYTYGLSGAPDAKVFDPATAETTGKLFDSACGDCHSREEGVAGASAPGLAGLGSRDHYTSFIGNPKSPVHMGPDRSEMPRFDRELTIVERDSIAEYLVWLRGATQADIDALGPL